MRNEFVCLIDWDPPPPSRRHLVDRYRIVLQFISVCLHTSMQAKELYLEPSVLQPQSKWQPTIRLSVTCLLCGINNISWIDRGSERTTETLVPTIVPQFERKYTAELSNDASLNHLNGIQFIVNKCYFRQISTCVVSLKISCNLVCCEPNGGQ